MNWNNVSLIVLGLSAFSGAFTVALWISLVIWTFRDMRSRSRDAFAQLLAALMALVLGPLGALLYLLLRPRETLAEKYERSLEEEALLQDIEERQICPGCKQPIESEYVLCPVCHVRLRQPCVHCGRLIHPRWSVCPYCGTSQRQPAGIDQAARVTLADIEREEGALPSGAAAQLRAERAPRLTETVVAGGAALSAADAETFDELDVGLPDEALDLAAETGWEMDDLEPDEGQELADLFPDAAPAEDTLDAGDDAGEGDGDDAGGGDGDDLHAADWSPADQSPADQSPAEPTAGVTDATQEGAEDAEEQTPGTDETPRRPLSLFKRH